MRNHKYAKIIRIVVDWWANALTMAKFDNRDNPFPAMALLIKAASPKIKASQIKKFKSLLTKKLKCNLDPERRRCFNLGTDYTPDFFLAECLIGAGIKASIVFLPWKASMRIYKNKITVRCGYRAPEQVLYLSTTHPTE